MPPSISTVLSSRPTINQPFVFRPFAPSYLYNQDSGSKIYARSAFPRANLPHGCNQLSPDKLMPRGTKTYNTEVRPRGDAPRPFSAIPLARFHLAGAASGFWERTTESAPTCLTVRITVAGNRASWWSQNRPAAAGRWDWQWGQANRPAPTGTAIPRSPRYRQRLCRGLAPR